MSVSQPILITGATGLIGRTLVAHFLGRGRTVIATSRRPAHLEALAAEMEPLPGCLLGFECNLADPNGAVELIERLTREGVHPVALVNNARDIENLTPDSDGSPSRAGWIAEFTLGVVAAYELIIAAANQPASALNAVVNVASIYGMVATNPSLYDDPCKRPAIYYGVVKAALIHLTKELAVRLADPAIRVNAVAFGGIEGRVNHEFHARYAKLSPQKRMLHAAEVTGAIEFLLSDAASGATGHNLVVDGGWTLW
jgi:NAD(P)-dependent dehydrogenase (short-subunit alcohol dehydrogenase family)